jgi:hypothetical protein
LKTKLPPDCIRVAHAETLLGLSNRQTLKAVADGRLKPYLLPGWPLLVSWESACALARELGRSVPDGSPATRDPRPGWVHCTPDGWGRSRAVPVGSWRIGVPKRVPRIR